jgi:FkbM family methyltransferase
MSIMTNPLVLRLRGVLRSTGATKFLARLGRETAYEKKYAEALALDIREGDVVWDVGANVGVYALQFSDWVGSAGRVFAFEPNPRNVARLMLNCGVRPNIDIRAVGLSSETLHGDMVDGEDDLGALSHIVAPSDASGGNRFEVVLHKGDALVQSGTVPVPNVIKIDVEGHEIAVLSGLKLTLADPRLRSVFLEVHFAILEQNGQADAPQKIEQKLREYGFCLNWTDPSHLRASRLMDSM